MNYRHAFHAGNFADLLKHAVLTALVRGLRKGRGPLTIVDSHAGAGAYDLLGDLARKTGEGEAGIGRLMRAADAPAAFDDLKAAVAAMNAAGQIRYYPGSPLLLTDGQRPGDLYFGCEIRPDDAAALRIALKGRRGAEAVGADGWRTAIDRARLAKGGAYGVVIDPPFEQADDYANIVSTTAAVLARRPDAAIAVWLPIKDLATYDAFLGDFEDAAGGAPVLVCEVRLRPLSDPLTMNGCAMALVRPPPGVREAGEAAGRWIAGHLGGAGARGSVLSLGA